MAGKKGREAHESTTDQDNLPEFIRTKRQKARADSRRRAASARHRHRPVPAARPRGNTLRGHHLRDGQLRAAERLRGKQRGGRSRSRQRGAVAGKRDLLARCGQRYPKAEQRRRQGLGGDRRKHDGDPRDCAGCSRKERRRLRRDDRPDLPPVGFRQRAPYRAGQQ